MFKRQDIKIAILNLPSNKDYKREKIMDVSISTETDDEIQILIGTCFGVFLVDILIDTGDALSIHGNIIETAYSDIDDLLYDSISQSILGEWILDIDPDNAKDVNIVVDEIVNSLYQEKWIEAFKFLNKTYNTLDNILNKSEDLDCRNVLEEMLSAYVDLL